MNHQHSVTSQDGGCKPVALESSIEAALRSILGIAKGGVVLRHETGKPTWSALEEIAKIASEALKAPAARGRVGVSIREVAEIHIRASGPVSFGSVLAYCEAQCTEVVERYRVAEEITALIRDGRVLIYDDGESFSSACD